MSREIKFRAWKMHNGKMTRLVHSPFAISNYAQSHLEEPVMHCQDVNDIRDFMPYADVIEQYTGFKDKYGREIYEGDIVKYGNQVCEVKFDEMKDSDCSYYYLGWAMGDLSLCEHYYMVVIIGNIHENKELLRGGE